MTETEPLQLRYLAHARSGDKGDTANVGLIALEPDGDGAVLKVVWDATQATVSVRARQ